MSYKTIFQKNVFLKHKKENSNCFEFFTRNFIQKRNKRSIRSLKTILFLLCNNKLIVNKIK